MANSGIMRAFLRCFVFVAATAVLVASEPNNLTKSQVTILKCCKFGEALQQSDNNLDETLHCQPTEIVWRPLIYSPTKGSFVNDMFSKWRILEGRRPECDNQSEIVSVPYRKNNPIFLMDNGFALLNSDGPIIPVNRYCGDSSALLVCMEKMNDPPLETQKPKVRRCCGENAVFHVQG